MYFKRMSRLLGMVELMDNKEYQLERYSQNQITKCHLLALVNLLTNCSIMEEFEGKIGEYWTEEKYVALTMPPKYKKWAWIDTKRDDYYHLYIEGTLNAESYKTFSSMEISQGDILLNRRWTRLTIRNTFNIFNTDFINFCKRRYHEYKEFKVSGHRDLLLFYDKT